MQYRRAAVHGCAVTHCHVLCTSLLLPPHPSPAHCKGHVHPHHLATCGPRSNQPTKQPFTNRSFSSISVVNRHSSGYWAIGLRVANMRKHQILKPSLRMGGCVGEWANGLVAPVRERAERAQHACIRAHALRCVTRRQAPHPSPPTAVHVNPTARHGAPACTQVHETGTTPQSSLRASGAPCGLLACSIPASPSQPLLWSASEPLLTHMHGLTVRPPSRFARVSVRDPRHPNNPLFLTFLAPTLSLSSPVRVCPPQSHSDDGRGQHHPLQLHL